MSDRIAVMSNGRVEQVGPPQEIYEQPATAYVADFLGVSNLMSATAAGASAADRCRVKLGEAELEAGEGDTDARGDVKLVIRPERVRVEPQGTAGPNRVPGMVDRVVYVGSVMHVMVTLPHGEHVQAWVQNEGGGLPYRHGASITLHFPVEALRVLIDTTSECGAGGDGGSRGRRRPGSLTDRGHIWMPMNSCVAPSRCWPIVRLRRIAIARKTTTSVATSMNVAAALTAGVGAARAAS